MQTDFHVTDTGDTDEASGADEATCETCGEAPTTTAADFAAEAWLHNASMAELQAFHEANMHPDYNLDHLPRSEQFAKWKEGLVKAEEKAEGTALARIEGMNMEQVIQAYSTTDPTIRAALRARHKTLLYEMADAREVAPAPATPFSSQQAAILTSYEAEDDPEVKARLRLRMRELKND